MPGGCRCIETINAIPAELSYAELESPLRPKGRVAIGPLLLWWDGTDWVVDLG